MIAARMKSLLLVTGFFTLITLIITWPLIFKMNSLIIDPYDGLLITWFLNWDIHALLRGFHDFHEWVNFFNANIFYPYKNTLAFSEYMLPQAILASPFVLFFNEPLLAYNINFLLGFIFSGTSLFYLFYHLTKKTNVAIACSSLFTLSIVHLNYMSHLQLFNIWPLIFSIHCLISRHYKLFVLTVIISTLTTPLFLYFLLPIVFLDVIINRKEVLKLSFHTLIALVILLPFLAPYFLVSRQFNYKRPINDAIHFSLQIPDLANISNSSRLSTLIAPIAKSTPAYPGTAMTALTVLMLFSIIRRLKYEGFSNFVRKSSKTQLFFHLLTIISFVLSLGPAFHVFRNTVHVGPIPAIPLPYLAFYYLVPGFSGFRTPSRWIILTFLCLSISIGLFFKKRFSNKFAIIIIFLTILEINFPLLYTHVPSRKNFPPEQKWLSLNYSNDPIIQFPIYNWSDQGKTHSQQGSFGQETLREYYSTIHFHPMFNGYSGFSPKDWENRVFWLQKEFPSNKSVEFLQSIKIRLVLVPSSWENRLLKFPQLKKVASFPQTTIFELI